MIKIKLSSEQLLTECAEMVIADMQTPKKLLYFLNEMSTWIHNYELTLPRRNDNQATLHFYVTVLIDQLV